MEEFIDYENGVVLLIDKPFSWTSFDVVNFIRKIMKVKVGHAGTLDPLATGLLILCTGKFTKKIDEYQAQEKEYTGTISIGATTPSFDLETKIDKYYDVSGITEKSIADAISTFIGSIQQLPPAHSAKQINGERAYLKARRGEEVKLMPKEVQIREFEATSIEFQKESIHVKFRVVCSKGTYIRSLARDLGEKLGIGAHLSELKRTRIGSFLLADAKSIEDIKRQFPRE